jgi:hypothetical protein
MCLLQISTIQSIGPPSPPINVSFNGFSVRSRRQLKHRDDKFLEYSEFVTRKTSELAKLPKTASYSKSRGN